MSLTLANALTAIRSRLDESTAAFWSDAELTTWVNEAQNDIARRTECLRDTATIAVTAGTQEYTGPVDLVRAHTVQWMPDSTSQIYPLAYRDRHSADSVWGSSQATTEGTPVIWTSWGFPPSLTITLYPTPIEDGNIKVHYYRLPVAVAVSANTVEVPAGWEDLVVEYAACLGYRKDGNPQWQQAFQAYESKLNDLYATAIRFNDQAGFVDDSIGVFAPAWLYAGTGDW